MMHNALVKLIRRRMKERGLQPHELAADLHGTLSKQTVYNFVEHGRVIKSDTLLVILNELGLAVQPVRKRKQP